MNLARPVAATKLAEPRRFLMFFLGFTAQYADHIQGVLSGFDLLVFRELRHLRDRCTRSSFLGERRSIPVQREAHTLFERESRHMPQSALDQSCICLRIPHIALARRAVDS